MLSKRLGEEAVMYGDVTDEMDGAGPLTVTTEVAVRLGQCPKPLHSLKLCL
jgi:hypothetical protein